MKKSVAGAVLAALLLFCGPQMAHSQSLPETPTATEPSDAQPTEAPPPVPPAQPPPIVVSPIPAPAKPVYDPIEIGVGGIIQIDGNWISADRDAPFGSPQKPNRDGLFARRAVLLLGGQVGGWRFRFEPDFASEPDTGAADVIFQDLYAAHRLGPGDLKIGQRRPFRGMEDLTASTDTLMMERPFASSAGVFNGGQSREFALGVFYQGREDHVTYGLGVYSLRAVHTPGTEGSGASLRMTLTPWVMPGNVLHIGASASYEDPANDQGAIPSTTPMDVGTAVAYAGSRGPVAVLGLTEGAHAAKTLGVEVAAALGPFFVQSEFMSQRLGQDASDSEHLVLAYYLQTSLFLTGETRPYNSREGVFRSPQPYSKAGAWEITARYDEAGNRHATRIDGGCGGSPQAQRCVASALTFGSNYYFSSGVRVMVNYIRGEADRGRAGTDSPTAVTARFQLAF